MWNGLVEATWLLPEVEPSWSLRFCIVYTLVTAHLKQDTENFQLHRAFLSVNSVQFSPSVMSDSLQLYRLQHARPPCLSPTPRVYPNSCPLSWWCHPTISSSVVPFTPCPESFSESGSFQMSQLFASGGQTIGVLASTSVFPMNTQDWFPLGWTGWISLQSKGLSRVFSDTTVQKQMFRSWITL